jgi:hypothetical protein
MTRSKSKIPIESFGAELFTALIEGSKRKIEVQTTYRNASHLRMRVHQLRQRMREEGHPLYPIAARCRLTITWEGNTKHSFSKNPDMPVTLTFAPHDSEFADLFKSAGLELNPTSNLSEALDEPTDAAERPLTLEDLFKDFK